MKRSIVILLLVLSSSSLFAQKEVGEFVQNIVEGLKKKNPLDLMPYFETEKEFKEIETRHYGEQYMKDKNYVAKLYANKRKQWYEDLNAMFKEGEAAGITWSEIEFDSYTFDNNVPLYDHRKEDIEIFVKYKDTVYELKIVTAVYFKKGWKIREDILWVGEKIEE